MKERLLFLTLLLSFCSISQSTTSIYTVVRKNFYTSVQNPLDTSQFIQVYDSSQFRIGTIDPVTGYTLNLGNQVSSGTYNMSGSAINPYSNEYYVLNSASNIVSFDLTNGNILNSVPTSNPNGLGFFENFRFNNSDSTLYGLARINIWDPVTNQNLSEVYFSSINVQTGVITQISQNSLTNIFVQGSSAIDPFNMVYYFTKGSNIIGVDIYNGNVYSNLPINNSFGTIFDNFAFNCVDSTLYGLVRNNDYPQISDSATVHLAKIDLSTGLVSLVSPTTVIYGFCAISGGSTIDPSNGVYYYSDGYNIMGISTQTGQLVTNSPATFQDGDFATLMRQYEDCKGAKPKRLESLSLKENDKDAFSIYPNPSSESFSIQGTFNVDEVQIYSADGRLLLTSEKSVEIDINGLLPGNYFIQISYNDKNVMKKFIKK